MTSASDDWFDIDASDWLDPGFRPKQLKLLADEQFPEPVLAEIRAAGVKVEPLPRGMRRPDESVLALAVKRRRVLLTLDADFWDDRKYPLHTVRTGIIYVAEPPERHDHVLRAFGLTYSCFAKSFPLDWWGQLKLRATVGQFEIKMRTWRSEVARYRLRLEGGRVRAQEL